MRHKKDNYTALEVEKEDDISETMLLINRRRRQSLKKIKKVCCNLATIKSIFLMIFAIFCAVLFTMVDEHHETLNLAAVSYDHPLSRHLPYETGYMKYQLSFHGLDEKTNDTLTLYVQGFNSTDLSWKNLYQWTFNTHTYQPIQHRIDFPAFNIRPQDYMDFQVEFVTDSPAPLGLSLDMFSLNPLARHDVIFGAIILLGLYVIIVFEFMHRTVAAMIIAFLALGTLAQLHERPTFELVISWINFETIGLLFGMMIMVGIITNTGIFEWAAIKAFKIAKGNLWHLTVILCIFTAVVSAFLDNVTTIILVAPVTITLCKVLNVDPTSIVLAEVIASNIGGTSTVIGDPPNIILMSNPNIRPHIDFLTFSLHVAPPTILALVVELVYFWKFFAPDLFRDPTLHLKAELSIWKKTLLKLQSNFNDEEGEQEVLNQLANYIVNLEGQIQGKGQQIMSITELEEKYKVKDWELLIKSIAVLLLVIVMFFMHSLVGLELSLAWIAIIGSLIHILVSGITHIDEILEKVELSTLMFFAALFILMKSLEELGLIQWLADGMVSLIRTVPEGQTRLLVAILLLLWISAFTSAFIDNIPYTVTLAPVVVELATSDLGLPLRPLVWALALGTCLGGNGTIIGASANVVGVGLCEREGFNVTFMTFLKLGMPVMILTVLVATVYLCIFNVLIHWD